MNSDISSILACLVTVGAFEFWRCIAVYNDLMLLHVKGIYKLHPAFVSIGVRALTYVVVDQ